MAEAARRLTVLEAAARAGVSVKTIRRAIERGDLHAVQPKGVRKIQLLEDQVDAWANADYVPPVRPAADVRTLPPRRRPARGSRDALRAIERGAAG